MADPSHILAEHLLTAGIPPGACCGWKVLTVVSFLVGLGFAVLLTVDVFTCCVGGHTLVVQEPIVTIANRLPPSKTVFLDCFQPCIQHKVNLLRENRRPNFQAFPRFNDQHHRSKKWQRYVKPTSQPLVTINSMPENLDRLKVAKALQEAGVGGNEILKSFVFFDYAHEKLSRPAVVDLCCGNGLVGLLFALFERKVKRVYLVDTAFPESTQKILEVLCTFGPWVKPKILYLNRTVQGIEAALKHEPDYGVVAVHACGELTDWGIQAAVARKAPLAVMPCCYSKCPDALQNQVVSLNPGIDDLRTSHLKSNGYEVSWQEIPQEICPMNRIISACHPRYTEDLVTRSLIHGSLTSPYGNLPTIHG
eukprot:gnl/MRDRNA2_/MRDRNA2_66391_c0_seq1.p1 gnl/MRDRNA2_/MRDRNA2_66391_c0~~gnl/MRDRNA2_/MRDRNA2_66391_c0_seq1.p1  ORF type:complete len:381 (-),score=42.41 gnl/MRDRNA2_/MRDRNA2_66391_c0_seq1:336-1427(-)